MLRKVLLCILPCFVALACLLVPAAHSGSRMPAFTLPSVVDGKAINSQEFQGKVLLVTFFATWCPPCRQEIPILRQLHDQLKDQGFSVVALSVDQGGPKVVAQLVAKEKIPYPVMMADRAVEKGFGGIAGIPTSFLVNKQGDVVRAYPGLVPHALLERDIRRLLK